MFKVEYLITVDKKDAFCGNISAFNNLIKTIDGVHVRDKNLTTKNLSIGYEVQMGEILADNQRYFHLKFSLEKEEELESFEFLLRSIRSVLHKASARPVQSLWDDLSLHYAKLAYPLIHELENTMRKLITKFMLINVGLGWFSDAIPQEVAESVRTKSSKLNHNYLYEVDFIQLSNFLFKEYATTAFPVLIEAIKKAKDKGDLDIDQLKLGVPSSNWDRYFSTLVQCESEYLRVRWDRLYEKRNLIAHNRPIGRFEFDEINNLCADLKPKLQIAIDSLDKITVDENDREVLSENVALGRTAAYGEFIESWKKLHHNLYILVEQNTKSETGKAGLNLHQSNTMVLLSTVRGLKLLNGSDYVQFTALNRIRNMIVHAPDFDISADELLRHLEVMAALNDRILEKIIFIEPESAN